MKNKNERKPRYAAKPRQKGLLMPIAAVLMAAAGVVCFIVTGEWLPSLVLVAVGAALFFGRKLPALYVCGVIVALVWLISETIEEPRTLLPILAGLLFLLSVRGMRSNRPMGKKSFPKLSIYAAALLILLSLMLPFASAAEKREAMESKADTNVSVAFVEGDQFPGGTAFWKAVEDADFLKKLKSVDSGLYDVLSQESDSKEDARTALKLGLYWIALSEDQRAELEKVGNAPASERYRELEEMWKNRPNDLKKTDYPGYLLMRIHSDTKLRMTADYLVQHGDKGYDALLSDSVSRWKEAKSSAESLWDAGKAVKKQDRQLWNLLQELEPKLVEKVEAENPSVLPAIADSLPMAMAALALALACLGCEAAVLERDVRAYRTVPAGSKCFTIGAWLYLAAAAIQVLLLFQSGGSESVPVLPLILGILAAFSAVKLIGKESRENWYFPGLVLMLAVFGLRMPMVLMLLAAIGFAFNKPLFRKLRLPLLNLLAILWQLYLSIREFPGLRQAYRTAKAVGSENTVLTALFPTLIFLAAIILLNLGSDYRDKPTGSLLRKLDAWCYQDVGSRLKSIAHWIGRVFLGIGCLAVLELGLSLLLGFFVNGTFLTLSPELLARMANWENTLKNLRIPALIALGASVLNVVLTFPLFAFGQITVDVHSMREEGPRSVSTPVPETAMGDNPDELPEL